LNESVKILDEFKNGSLPANISNKKLWEAQKIKQVCIKPI
jgi:hypothetical protein